MGNRGKKKVKAGTRDFSLENFLFRLFVNPKLNINRRACLFAHTSNEVKKISKDADLIIF